jgi:hypothetical protein
MMQFDLLNPNLASEFFLSVIDFMPRAFFGRKNGEFSTQAA